MGALLADLSSFGRFAKGLEKQDAAALRKRIRTAVNTVGADVLKEIRADASWSTGSTSTKKNPHSSIPAATRLRTSLAARGAGITVATNGRRAPHARPLERGSKGSGGAYDRHPVFAKGGLRPGQLGPLRNRSHFRNKGGYEVVYFNQPTRPFFYKNADKGKVAFPKLLQEQLNVIAKELGY
jgi:hypothetical protein